MQEIDRIVSFLCDCPSFFAQEAQEKKVYLTQLQTLLPGTNKSDCGFKSI